MSLRAALRETLQRPTPDALWELRTEIFLEDRAEDDPVWEVVDGFHEFLSELSATATARQYSHYASLLDIAAVGGVAFESVLEEGDPGDKVLRLLLAGISEGLMVLATRQHVKAWGSEMDSVYRKAAWSLQAQLWRLARDSGSGLEVAKRRELIDTLLRPLRDGQVSGEVKAVIIGRLFQLLLAARSSPRP